MTKAKAAVMAYNGVQFKGNQLSIRLVRDRSRARIMEEGVQHGCKRLFFNSTLAFQLWAI